MTAENAYANAARIRKAETLAHLAARHGLHSADLSLMRDKEWSLLAQAAHVNPGSQTTRDLVIRLAEESEAAS
jgi:hypothetical protein